MVGARRQARIKRAEERHRKGMDIEIQKRLEMQRAFTQKPNPIRDAVRKANEDIRRGR